MKKLLFIVLIAFGFSSCEKDDICSDETTPKLILEFFNISDPTSNLNVTNLKVLSNYNDEDKELGTFNAVSKIGLPLLITEDTTTYKLILNSTNTLVANEDILQFNYARNEVFVSRACGFKMTYQLNSPGGVVHTDGETLDQKWIKNIVIETNSITTANETHIKIYF